MTTALLVGPSDTAEPASPEAALPDEEANAELRR